MTNNIQIALKLRIKAESLAIAGFESHSYCDALKS